MTARVDFFCSPEEEREVLRYLTKSAGTRILDICNGAMVAWDGFSTDVIPAAPEPLEVYLWPSSLERAGPEFARWVKRSLAWIRRRGTIVHDYRRPSTTLPNPHSTLNTIYAFPEVLEAVRSADRRFTLQLH